MGIIIRDSDEIWVLFGVRWEFMVVIIGFVKVGYKEKDFEVVMRSIFYGIDWEVGIEW